MLHGCLCWQEHMTSSGYKNNINNCGNISLGGVPYMVKTSAATYGCVVSGNHSASSWAQTAH